MIDLYLRGDSEAHAKNVLPDFLDMDGNWQLATKKWCFDPIGEIVATPAVLDGFEIVQPAVMKPGWHANIRLLDESLLPVIEASGLLIEPPDNPVRKWA